jgi:hypothetical protein
MKVKELIEILSIMDSDQNIVIEFDSQSVYELNSVEVKPLKRNYYNKLQSGDYYYFYDSFHEHDPVEKVVILK